MVSLFLMKRNYKLLKKTKKPRVQFGSNEFEKNIFLYKK